MAGGVDGGEEGKILRLRCAPLRMTRGQDVMVEGTWPVE